MANEAIPKHVLESRKFLTTIQHNIVKILEEHGSLSRRDLVRISKAPRTTIYDNLVKLQKLGKIQKFSRSNGERGRPLVFWKTTS
jgi:Fe2+ or Zn2+ uptake regulation protein